MPIAPTYPGVYIEEIPSGVRTIVGVATSITAFLGRAAAGPESEPTTINNFGDFDRQFGGLSPNYPMSYAVRDFFLNGGSQATIVRLTGDGAPRASLNVGSTNPLALEAASSGTWGNNLYAAVDYDGITTDVASRFGLDIDQLFNLTVEERAIVNGISTRVRVEQFRNVAVDKEIGSGVAGSGVAGSGTSVKTAGARRVDRVLQGSSLVRLRGSLPGTRPGESEAATGSGTSGSGVVGSGTTGSGTDGSGTSGSGVSGSSTALATISTPTIVTTAGRQLQLTQATADSGASGSTLDATDFTGNRGNKTGLYALEKADLFNLLCIPPDTRDGDTSPAVYQEAMAYCAERRAMLIVDPPAAWATNKETAATRARDGLNELGLTGPRARNAALYFPRVRQADPMREGQIDTFVPCGIIAGVMAFTDTTRGVWKAPAGLDAALNGVQGLEVNLSDDENGMLNPLGINCLRSFPVIGRVVWGARTLRGADQLADEYKYIPIRRLALFIEESLYRGTQWVVFEPNDEPLWAQIRLNVGAFMNRLFRQGAFQGTTPREAYFVKCDKETNPQADVNLGIVNIVVGFAPLKPAEFVIIKIQQIPGQIEV